MPTKKAKRKTIKKKVAAKRVIPKRTKKPFPVRALLFMILGALWTLEKVEILDLDLWGLWIAVVVVVIGVIALIHHLVRK